jgi:predicted phage terminase large subunit-like protein
LWAAIIRLSESWRNPAEKERQMHQLLKDGMRPHQHRSPFPRPVRASDWHDKPPGYEEATVAGRGNNQAIGVDLAFTPDAGDHTTIVLVTALGERYYVRHLQRARRDIIEIRAGLLVVSQSYPGTPLVSYVSDSEKRSVLPLLAANDGPLVFGIPARHEKRVRAIRTSELWNSGRIIVPPGRAWTQDFTKEMRDFSGKKDEPDDQVDALVAAIDFLEACRSVSDESFGSMGRTRV